MVQSRLSKRSDPVLPIARGNQVTSTQAAVGLPTPATGPAPAAQVARTPSLRPSEVLQLQRQFGNREVTRWVSTTPSHAPRIALDAVAGSPGGPDPCMTLLQEIIFWLDEVAKRINDALLDEYELFKYYRRIKDSHPDHGSWDGHRDRYYRDRDQLRRKLAEWEADDDCRGRQLTLHQQEELDEAVRFKHKEYPTQPAEPTRRIVEEPSMREKVADALRRYGVPAFAIGTLVVLVVAALADPEPFSKVALIVGTAAAVMILIAIGRKDDVPPEA